MLCSDNPRKCCKYARKRKDESYLLRCKVIMGDIKVSQDLTVILLISCMVFIHVILPLQFLFCKNSFIYWSEVAAFLFCRFASPWIFRFLFV